MVSLFNMADDEIGDLFELACADFVIDMKESHERDPEGFVCEVMGCLALSAACTTWQSSLPLRQVLEP